MIVFNQANTGRVEYMLDVLGIKGFTFFEQVQGRGTNGGEPRRGTHAWPEMNSCVITVVEEEQLPALLESIRCNSPLSEASPLINPPLIWSPYNIYPSLSARRRC